MNYIVKTLIYATITLGLVACSQEDINSIERQKAKEEITFTVDVTLDKNVEDMVNAKQMPNVWDAEQPAATRTPITYDKQGSLTYNWRVGSTIPLFVYITDGKYKKVINLTKVCRLSQPIRVTLHSPYHLILTCLNCKWHRLRVRKTV